VLGHAHQHPELTGNLGNIALLRIAGELGLIDPQQALAAGNAYREYRRLQHAKRLSATPKALQRIADLAQQQHVFRRRRRRRPAPGPAPGSLRRRLICLTIMKMMKARMTKLTRWSGSCRRRTPGCRPSSARPASVRFSGLSPRTTNRLEKSSLPSDHGHQRHDQVADDGVDDLAESRADDDADREIHRRCP
jgi:hypothetical protein